MILTKYKSDNSSLRDNFALTAVVLLLSQLSHAEVYKTTTSEGQVVYTDNINTAYQYNKSSKNISVLDKLPTQSQVSSTTTQPATTSTSLNNQVNNAASKAADIRLPDSLTGRLSTQSISASQQGDYVLKIVSPKAGQTLRRGSQPIEINVALTPSLKTGDRIVYQLNNQTLATMKATSYTIATTTLDPNPYTITVRVENVLGEIIAQDTRAINLISNNVLYQKKRKAIAQAQKKQANQPWYKKIL
ncbi:MAG: DUF4124 domain-containing protein [Moraxella sp.]|jgi:hypothetical protein|nr:DUF4124 domain-containing protein [Moraxella osloensis]MBP6341288.1 DUF4124 domain-containing protein [Moraxella sp.]MBP6485425.1 DUF4124 domain-containing protein [Moraxella sp.]MBP7234261.1 DUF4124 domain-containing protein [Moraxella sp.]